ncbi:MAG: CRISPR-associated endonuclease Cas3'' [Desulfovibrio sp.]|jgi:CRISPR-associated endonuclease/helicase Cas3|nr:CRISPR-associated endonuclease Cas3'' [Desulfovibrio sp.]
MAKKFIARIRKDDYREQTVREHLEGVSERAGRFAEKAGIPRAGRLSGLLHDFGKYSTSFQEYIRSCASLRTEPDEPDKDGDSVPVPGKGKVDHSTAGAQLVWEHYSRYSYQYPYYAQILALAVCSHHSGLIDCLARDGQHVFSRRMRKEDAKTHLAECRGEADASVLAAVEALMRKPLLLEMRERVAAIIRRHAEEAVKVETKDERCDHANALPFSLGLLSRFLLSCLLDADRIDSAVFEDEQYAALRARLAPSDWALLLSRLERKLADFPRSAPIAGLRAVIADHCAAKGGADRGIFTLTVPTGGGKTLSSLRFALAHAQKHGLDRIIYVIPYTSIIDQNAAVARAVLERDDEAGSIVLEHHSNLLPEKESPQSKLLSAGWESPVVFTTMVQFLETLFGSGTRSARRMHNLARSVLIFDEIQTLPLCCTHMFCNALNFLVHDCGASAVLCTATQPLLGNLPFPFRGQLSITPESEIIPDVPVLFDNLQRVTFRNHCLTPYDEQAIAELARKELRDSGSCLIVVNTKKWAERLFRICSDQDSAQVFYLSTHLCPAHRIDILERIQQALNAGERVICVSTQLIECGVDISFGSVIRFAAGLDSVLQAAGRCNRHGERPKGRVHIVAVPAGEENLDFLPAIQTGKQVFLRLVHEDAALSGAPNTDLNNSELIRRYFTYYFYEQAQNMSFPIPGGDTLLRLYGRNNGNPGFKQDTRMLYQSFAAAAALFRPIDAPTQGILVPYKHGAEIIAELASASGIYRKKTLLREAQRYTVNLYSGIYKQLCRAKAVTVLPETGLLCLREGWYSDTAGICTEPVGDTASYIM